MVPGLCKRLLIYLYWFSICLYFPQHSVVGLLNSVWCQLDALTNLCFHTLTKRIQKMGSVVLNLLCVWCQLDALTSLITWDLLSYTDQANTENDFDCGGAHHHLDAIFPPIVRHLCCVWGNHFTLAIMLLCSYGVPSTFTWNSLDVRVHLTSHL